MAHSRKLIQTIKQQLKQQGITYKQLAKDLHLSESAVKQMFASGNFTLRRLDDICDILGLSFSYLANLADNSAPQKSEIPLALEQQLIEQPKLLLVAYLLIDNWQPDDIQSFYTVDDNEMLALLIQLDRMEIIELQPNNRIRLLLNNEFKWQPNGPIERYFAAQVQHEFLSQDFSADNALRVVRNATITAQSLSDLQIRLAHIGEVFSEISHKEKHLPQRNKMGVTMMLAIRHWEYSAFKQFQRKQAD
ncbi:helix-turn-helix domain-containing protein [Ostreibacterium oceani]|uniref:Helix-turn-helix domain-containing protein n=1 Tax=Ostreibacterium oceani TaxID=2654998 RepID=A0A6N7EU98_9GAMM|nr:helix-turn-helix transcriptional regulator [Ostreibacterium oceani]MPV86131.1 helix-turn-helix domain-containing protein [Ostreibacterium oceani]